MMAAMHDKTILIIDDDSRNIFALKAVLKSRGYACRTAITGKEGLEILFTDPAVSIVLLDMMMPELDGYELLSLIKTRHPDLPAIAVTAQAMVGDREKCLEAGADEYIAKPIDVDRLTFLLQQYLK